MWTTGGNTCTGTCVGKDNVVISIVLVFKWHTYTCTLYTPLMNLQDLDAWFVC